MALTGRTALVTGAAQGIGRASALGLARAGADIVGVDIDAGGVEKLNEDVVALGAKCLPLAADCGDVAAIDEVVQKTIDAFGRLDILVNNAGVTRRAFIMDLTEEDFDRINRVNTKGVFFFMQRAAREMMARDGGRIINMASIAGKGFTGSSNVIYAGTKGAVNAMTLLAASQLGPHNITVNAVCPGVTETEIYRGIAERDAERSGVSVDEVMARVTDTIPLRRTNSPEDIAAAVVFLAGESARNITGQTLNVDGGLVPG